MLFWLEIRHIVCIRSKFLCNILCFFKFIIIFLIDTTYSLYSATLSFCRSYSIGQGANTGFESSHELIKAMIECDGNWKSAFISYEKEHKARADLIQAFANLMGCSQLQQKDLLPNKAVSRMYKWINSKDPTDLPSDDILDIIKQFNPLSQRGVSSIS